MKFYDGTKHDMEVLTQYSDGIAATGVAYYLLGDPIAAAAVGGAHFALHSMSLSESMTSPMAYADTAAIGAIAYYFSGGNLQTTAIIAGVHAAIHFGYLKGMSGGVSGQPVTPKS